MFFIKKPKKGYCTNNLLHVVKKAVVLIVVVKCYR